MPACCQCNTPGKGPRCLSCVCVKNNKACVSCAPGCESQCCNRLNRLTFDSLERLPSLYIHNDNVVQISGPVSPLNASVYAVSSGCLVVHSALDGNQHPSAGSSSSAANDTGSSRTVSERNHKVFLNEHFQRAFGATLVNSEGGPDSGTGSIWWKFVALWGKQYTLPDGNVGTRFINILEEEIEKSNEKKQASEKEFIFTALVLQ